MDKRGQIVGALFLLMFGFGLASLGFQFVLDRLSPGHSSDAAYYVFGTLATAGASGYASLFYFVVRNLSRSAPDPPPPPPPYDQGEDDPEGTDGWSNEGGYWLMRGDRR